MFKRAFTLIEILVVIAVVGILLAIVFYGFGSAKSKARDAQRKADLQSLKTAIETSFAEPVDGVKSAKQYFVATTPIDASSLTWLIGKGYIVSIPKDPLTGSSYKYMTDSTGKNYAVFAPLENSKDPDATDASPNAGISPAGYNYFVQNQ